MCEDQHVIVNANAVTCRSQFHIKPAGLKDLCVCWVNSHHFRQQLGGQVMDGFSQNTQGGKDENNPQDDTGSEEEKERGQLVDDEKRNKSQPNRG